MVIPRCYRLLISTVSLFTILSIAKIPPNLRDFHILNTYWEVIRSEKTDRENSELNIQIHKVMIHVQFDKTKSI